MSKGYIDSAITTQYTDKGKKVSLSFGVKLCNYIFINTHLTLVFFRKGWSDFQTKEGLLMESVFENLRTYDIMCCTLPGAFFLENLIIWLKMLNRYFTNNLDLSATDSAKYITMLCNSIDNTDNTILVFLVLFIGYFIGVIFSEIGSLIGNGKVNDNEDFEIFFYLKNELKDIRKLNIVSKKDKDIIQRLLRLEPKYEHLVRLEDVKRFIRNTILALSFSIMIAFAVTLMVRSKECVGIFSIYSIGFLLLIFVLNNKYKRVLKSYKKHLEVYWFEKLDSLNREDTVSIIDEKNLQEHLRPQNNVKLRKNRNKKGK